MHYRLTQFLVCAALATAAAVPEPGLAREVTAGPDEVIEARARVRFATAIVLDPAERILDWVCGDAEYWSVQGAANLAFVKPSAEGIETNVTLVTDNGNVYTLRFREVSDSDGEPDLKLFLRPKEPSSEVAAPLEPLGFEPRGAAAALEREAESFRQESQRAIERARHDAEQRVEAFRAAYPRSLRFEYELDREAQEAPFRVAAMWLDDRFTYIRADPEEAPALYESRDGKPSMVPYDFYDGLYVTRRPLADGWLQIGKRKVRFRRAERQRGVRK
ncbi:MAG: hypothetical protein F4X12_02085 [Acidobacteriia bacterium]|nr:hypothetical protein [Terriglobia bacterium]